MAVRWGLKISNGQMWARNYAHYKVGSYRLDLFCWDFSGLYFFFFFYHRLKQIYTDSVNQTETKNDCIFTRELDYPP